MHLGVFIVVAAYVSYAACSHQAASTTTKTTCSNCTAQGVVPVNDDSSCSYEQAAGAVFCDCSANHDCRSGSYTPMIFVENFSGKCLGGACADATLSGYTTGFFTFKYSQACE
jgi:hypothetical protein